MREVRTLVLWDIDHTLVSIDGLSREIYAQVFHEVTGRSLEKLAPMAGRTDWAITAETLRLQGITASPGLIETFAEHLSRQFSARRGDIEQRGRELPGARAALIALAARKDVIQSVLTGNMRSIAVCKLTAFALSPFVDLDVGAYGLDSPDRPALVQLARQRAQQKYGEKFDPVRTVLIGDTPHDVHAGHQGGARVVAVATGSSDMETLGSAGAEVILPDLADTDSVVRAVIPSTAP